MCLYIFACLGGKTVGNDGHPGADSTPEKEPSGFFPGGSPSPQSDSPKTTDHSDRKEPATKPPHQSPGKTVGNDGQHDPKPPGFFSSGSPSPQSNSPEKKPGSGSPSPQSNSPEKKPPGFFSSVSPSPQSNSPKASHHPGQPKGAGGHTESWSVGTTVSDGASAYSNTGKMTHGEKASSAGQHGVAANGRDAYGAAAPDGTGSANYNGRAKGTQAEEGNTYKGQPWTTHEDHDVWQFPF